MTPLVRLALGLALGALLATLPLLHFGWGGHRHAVPEDSHAHHATAHAH